MVVQSKKKKCLKIWVQEVKNWFSTPFSTYGEWHIFGCASLKRKCYLSVRLALLNRWYRNVTNMFKGCCRSVRKMLQEWERGFRGHLYERYKCVIGMLHGYYKSVTWLLKGCFLCVTWMLLGFHRVVAGELQGWHRICDWVARGVLQTCYKGVKGYFPNTFQVLSW